MVRLMVKSYNPSGRLGSIGGLDQLKDVMDVDKIVELKKKLGFKSTEDFPSRCGDIHRRTKKIMKKLVEDPDDYDPNDIYMADRELFKILEEYNFRIVVKGDDEMTTMTTILELDNKPS